MAEALAKSDGDAEQQPSHKAIDNGNPARFNPTWLVLDDVNIDLISIATFVAVLTSVMFFHLPLKLAALPLGAILLPLRAFFPRPRIPQGRFS